MEIGLFELYEMMDQMTECGMMMKSNEEEQESLPRGFFEIKNMQDEIQRNEANFNQPDRSQVFSHAPSLLPHRALHKRTLRSHRRFRGGSNCDVSGFSSTAFEKVTIRNHPSAPYTRYGHHMQQHHKHRILHSAMTHSQQVTEYPCTLYSQLPRQVGCTQVKSARISKHSQQSSRGLTCGSLSSDALIKGIPLRNVPTVPSPYITQIKHNEKTSKYISQLNNKAISLTKKECFGKSNEDNCNHTKSEVVANKFVDNTSFDNCFENFLPNSMYDDSSLSSPEQQYTFRTACLKPRLRYSASQLSTNLNSSENEAAFKDTVPPPSEDKKEGKDSSGIGREVPTCSTTYPESQEILEVDIFLKENVLQSSEMLTENLDEIHHMQSCLPDDSGKSFYYDTSQNDSRFSKCLSVPNKEELMDVNSPDEDLSTEDGIADGLKMDVSFSFMEKGGYHPIALPLGCHIFEDDSASSENELEDGSILEKRMTKMGREEFNLNVDNSTTFMPWIVIPLDEVPGVNYSDYVDFLDPHDPRLKEPVIEDSLNIEATDLMTEEPMKVPVSTEGNAFNDIQVLSNVENLDFENMDRVIEEAEYMTQESFQNSHGKELDPLNFSFTDFCLQKNVQSLDFSDKFFDSVSKDSETGEAKEGPIQENNSGSHSEGTLSIFDTKEISGTSRIEKNLTGLDIDTPSIAILPAEDTVSFMNTNNSNLCMQDEKNENKTTYKESSSFSKKIKKLPHSTIQLLKESFEFLKDQSLSRRRIRRLRRVSTSLRVADFALPTYLEEFYVENESCNYAEQSDDLLQKGNLNLGSKDSEPIERRDFHDELKSGPVTPRRSKRVANKNIENSSQKPLEKRNRNDNGKAQQTVQDSPQVCNGKHSSSEKNPLLGGDEKTKSVDANDKELVVQFSGKKYKCNRGVLTPINGEKSQKDSQKDCHLSVNYDKNGSKTQHIAKMKNSVVKRALENKDSASFNKKSSCKKLESSQPKVLVQNCLQEIALSAGKSSKKVTTRKSNKVHIIKTTVKKELFPKKNKNQCKANGTPQSLKIQKLNLKAKKKGSSVLKKKVPDALNQTPSSTKRIKTKSVKEKRDVCAFSHNGNASKSKKEYTASIVERQTASELQRKYVKPIIKVHQGLRNTSLQKFKEKQTGKQKNVVSKKTASLRKAFPCPNCEKRFNKASQSDRHFKEDHQCSQCDEVSVSKHAKQTHFYYCHASEVHVCLTCQKRYSQPYHLRKHFETQSHKELIRCLLKEIKKVKGGKSLVSKRLSVKNASSKPVTYPHKGLDYTSDQTVEKHDHFAQVRSKRKQKFMEMESSFFDENPDLLEFVHKIDYVDGQSKMVKHYLYKDPDLAEIQSRVKEESRDSYYEEIEIINEYSITSSCENFLGGPGIENTIGDRKRSFENRYSKASTCSKYLEQDSAWSSSCYPNNQYMYQDFESFNPIGCKGMSMETRSSSAVSGWFSAAMDAIEPRNLEDDTSYSTYIGVISSEPTLANNPTTIQTFHETICQEIPAGGSYNNDDSMAISRSNQLNQYPLDSKSSFLKGQELPNFGTDGDSPVIPCTTTQAEQVSAYSADMSSYSAGYDPIQTSTVNTTDEKKSVLLDVAKSLILLSNPEPYPDVDYISNNHTYVKPEDDIQREWESICSEIEKDVRDY